MSKYGKRSATSPRRYGKKGHKSSSTQDWAWSFGKNWTWNNQWKAVLQPSDRRRVVEHLGRSIEEILGVTSTKTLTRNFQAESTNQTWRHRGSSIPVWKVLRQRCQRSDYGQNYQLQSHQAGQTWWVEDNNNKNKLWSWSFRSPELAEVVRHRQLETRFLSQQEQQPHLLRHLWSWDCPTQACWRIPTDVRSEGPSCISWHTKNVQSLLSNWPSKLWLLKQEKGLDVLRQQSNRC